MLNNHVRACDTIISTSSVSLNGISIDVAPGM